MITYSIIRKSQLEGALRLDAEYYQPEYLNLISKLKTQKSKLLNNILQEELFYGLDINSLPEHLLKNAITSEMVNQPIFTLDFEKIQPDKINPKYLGRMGDILFAVRGNTCGKVAILLEDQKLIIGNNIVVCRLKPPASPFSTFLFLISELGRTTIERIITGTAQKQIVIEELKNIAIPLFSPKNNKVAEDLIFEIFNYLKDSEGFYKKAENLLLEELGLKDFKVEDDLFYVVNLSEIKSAHRAEAEYFQPKYAKIEKILSKFKQQRLEDISLLISYGTVPTSPYVEDGVPYVKGENLRNCFIDYSKLVYLEKESTKKLPKKFYLKEGDIIISQMGTVGQAGLVTKDEDGWLFASFTIRVRLKDEVKSILDPLFVTLYIQNISRPYYLLRRIAQASVRQNTDLPTIKDLRIPILPQPTQQKIADLVQQSHEARKKAKQLLEEAKRKVKK
jgi:restriction endonuclease S subunit